MNDKSTLHMHRLCKVTVSVTALYFKYGEHLANCDIRVDNPLNPEPGDIYLIGKEKDLTTVCPDSAEVLITRIDPGDGSVWLKSEFAIFCLEAEEFETAVMIPLNAPEINSVVRIDLDRISRAICKAGGDMSLSDRWTAILPLSDPGRAIAKSLTYDKQYGSAVWHFDLIAGSRVIRNLETWIVESKSLQSLTLRSFIYPDIALALNPIETAAMLTPTPDES